MAEINASYIKRQIAKLAYQDPRGDGFERVFPDIPVDPGVNQDCCATDGGTNPMDMPCAGMFVYIWTTLVPACLREQKIVDDPAPFLQNDSVQAFQFLLAEMQNYLIKNPSWRPEDLSLSPEDFDRYNDANDDFPVTIPPHLYLGDWDCEIDIWKIIPYSDTNFDWPRDETGEPIGPNLPGDRANRKIKLQEILQCFRRFYASVLAQQGEHTLNWDLNNPCCSIANLNKMMTIMRLFACLSTITEGNIPHAAGGTRIISDKLRQKMIKCINCIDKKCQLA
jgi:hypothetical protein